MGVTVLMLLLVLSGSAAAGGNNPAQADRSSPGSMDVINSRFVRRVTLDGGEVVVTPAPKHLHPRRDGDSVEVEAWATGQLMGYQSQAFGFGLATIHDRAKGVPTVRNLPAWIGFATAPEAFSCPAIVPSPTAGRLSALPSAGEAAVIIGASPGGPAVVYQARSETCGGLAPARLSNAQEEISITWMPVGLPNEVSIDVEATIPACGSLMGSGSSGSAAAMTVFLAAVVPEDTAHFRCKPDHLIDETVMLGPGPTPGAPPPLVSAATKILHAATGPVRVVEPQDPQRP